MAGLITPSNPGPQSVIGLRGAMLVAELSADFRWAAAEFRLTEDATGAGRIT